MAGENGPPLLRVVRGDATAEETAALAVALTLARAAAQRAGAAQTAGQRAGQHRTGAWSDRSRLPRFPHAHGPGAWRASALPR